LCIVGYFYLVAAIGAAASQIFFACHKGQQNLETDKGLMRWYKYCEKTYSPNLPELQGFPSKFIWQHPHCSFPIGIYENCFTTNELYGNTIDNTHMGEIYGNVYIDSLGLIFSLIWQISTLLYSTWDFRIGLH